MSEPAPREVFVVGLDDFNHRQLRGIHGGRALRFHRLLRREDVDMPQRYRVMELLEEAAEALAAHPGRIDAVVAYFDLPVSPMLPLLRRRLDLPGPSLESVLRCEHKYWSRVEQRAVVPECVPRFVAFDPQGPDPLREIPLEFPFWVKPVKSLGSFLGFRADDPRSFHRGLAAIRQHIPKLGEPFDWILEQAERPAEVAHVGGGWCLAEELISAGEQCTLEGYVLDGEVAVYGVIDSLREPGLSSFASYRYPSQLPGEVVARMVDVVRRFLTHVGFDRSPFNVELFYERERDQIWLLEVNTRLSQSHGPLFEMVDGVSHHQVMVDVALGRQPRMPRRRGTFPLAEKFFLRSFLPDGVVRRVPTAGDLARLQRALPDVQVRLGVKEGDRLSELPEQESYSYELGFFWVGGRDEAELRAKRDLVRVRLPLDVAPLRRGDAAA